ncbi:MAG: Gfo/Idh/MocA family oxidoreductase [Clostridiales bacterium]|nr:Gfo/Idh/MocA family oxidoreductase [Clostridiales bacterium]
MKNKVRIALIGAGGMGRKYAEMICGGETDSLVLTAVVCRNEGARQWALTLAGRPEIYESAEALYAVPEKYDAVLIVTPHQTHPELARLAFRLGKHVFCDKPAGITVSQAVSMRDEAEKAGRIYGMMFHQRRYPKYRAIRELLEKGELGRLERIMLVNSRYYRTAYYHHSGSWRSSWNGEGGGALINQGQHILDMWQWLFGMPLRLYAQIPFGKYNDFLVDDEATISMTYPDGLTAVFMLTTGEAVWQERLEITGSRGKILMEDDTLHIWRYSMDIRQYGKTAQVTSRELLTTEEEIRSFDKAEEPYAQMLENFARAVLSVRAEELVAPGAEAVNALALANAAYLSAWKGEAVTLPFDAEEYDRELAKRMEEERRREGDRIGIK